MLQNKPLDQPVSLDELRRMPYLHKVWKETHRLRKIAGAAFGRRATVDSVLPGSGVQVRKGTDILCLTPSTQVDPAIWSDPKSFKPERWGHNGVRGGGDCVPAGSLIPFGIGANSCPGKFLADFESPLLIAERHGRFWFSLACAPEEVVTYSSSAETPKCVSMDGSTGVPVHVELK